MSDQTARTDEATVEKPYDYDVIFFDTVGNSFTRESLKTQPSGAAEIAIVKYAHWLADAGYSVLVMNGIERISKDGGVTYVNNHFTGYSCRALVISRYSRIPDIQADTTVIWSVDASVDCHLHQLELLDSRRATLICLSPWHASLFPRNWPIRVIPSALPDRLYERSTVTIDPNKFVYCSAALKGLKDTLIVWKHFKEKYPQLADAQLCITTPGYDKPDLEQIAQTPGALYLGDLQSDAVEQELRSAEGMFFVNTFQETFCLAAVLAETVGCRPHILLAGGQGAIPWTVRSSLVTNDAATFEREFIQHYEDNLFTAAPVVAHNFRMSRIMPEWLDVLGLETQKIRITARTPICLTLIVSEKTTTEALTRCVGSVRNIIDCGCVVVDPGSKQHAAIAEAFGRIPVQIHEEPWVGFGHNRSRCIELARGMAPYDLMIDADDHLEFEPWFQMPVLDRDQYDILIRDVRIEYWRPHIFRNDDGYRYEGAMHEYLTKETPIGMAPRLHGISYMRSTAGADQQRHDKAIAALAPQPRSLFYYAQELKDQGRIREAMHAYSVRAELTTGFWEEVFVSLLEVARCHVRLGDPMLVVEIAYAKAYDQRPQRAAEVLWELSCYFTERKDFRKGYGYASKGCVPFPEGDSLFVDRSAYDWKVYDQVGICCFYLGQHEEGKAVYERLLASGRVPAEQLEHIKANLKWCVDALAKGG